MNLTREEFEVANKKGHLKELFCPLNFQLSYFFFIFYKWNLKDKITKSLTRCCRATCSGFPYLPLVIHRQLLPVFSLTREWEEGREEELRCFHCVFYDLSLTAPIVEGLGEKEKGPQLRRAAFQINLCIPVRSTLAQ